MMATMKNLPSQDRLRDLLDYDQDTGVFRWRISPARNVKVGDVAGTVLDTGYRQIKIDGKKYRAHRLAFVWMSSDCPDLIDHIDRNPNNNAWRNLRPATHSQNSGNSIIRKNNTSGVKGVRWHAGDGKWQAQIGINGQTKCLGRFDNIDDAAKAYERAAIEKWGRFANPEVK